MRLSRMVAEIGHRRVKSLATHISVDSDWTSGLVLWGNYAGVRPTALSLGITQAAETRRLSYRPEACIGNA